MRFYNNVRFVRFVVVALAFTFASACGSKMVRPSPTISPGSAQVAFGKTLDFTASDAGSWAISPDNCGSVSPGFGMRTMFTAGSTAMSCTITVNVDGREGKSSIQTFDDSTPPPPPLVVRASIGPIAAVYDGDPDCHIGCAPAVEVKPNAEECYVISDRGGTIKGMDIFNPRKPGRSIRKIVTLTGSDDFQNRRDVKEYPDETAIVGGITFGGGISTSHTQVGFYEFRLEEFGGDLPSMTVETVRLKICKP